MPYREPEEEPETEVEGVFVDDWYEYLVNHEMFAEPPRTFHICTAHPLARRVQVNGVLPSDFACPLDHAAEKCPMRKILAQSPGQAFVLTGKASRSAGSCFMASLAGKNHSNTSMLPEK